MLGVDEALALVLAEARPLPPRACGLADAAGCVLAEDVAADRDSPPFDKSLVDGYAIRAADLRGSPAAALVVGQEILAGQVPARPLGPGEAAVIMTGAPLPEGADAVVMHEQTRREGAMVLFDTAGVKPGQNRLARATEMRAGEIVLERGSVLNPARIGLLASVGRAEVRVVPRPHCLVVPTGDELVEPPAAPGPGQIRNSNAPMLRALAIEHGASAETTSIAPDEPRALRELLRRGLEADVLLVTGGVSAGARDLVPGALEALGVRTVFHKVRLRPGKPLLFGIGPPRTGDRPGALVFGLPGNPVSGVVGFLLFVRPALEVLRGGQAPTTQTRPMLPLAARYVHRGERATCHPARRVETPDGPRLETLAWAGSPDLRSVCRADGFACIPAGDRILEAGELVEFLPLGPGPA